MSHLLRAADCTMRLWIVGLRLIHRWLIFLEKISLIDFVS